MIRVMIADDQIIVREGLKKILSLDDEIKVVCEAENGYDVLEKLESNVVDIILMDVRMPKMDGIKASSLVKSRYPNVKIIILTTFNEDEYLFNGIKNGISGYLLKDSEVDYIIKSIKEAYENKMMFDPCVTPKLVNALNDKTEDKILKSDDLKKLTEREIEVLRLAAKGRSNREIGDILFISEGTVKNYISKILGKLNLQRRSQLAAYMLLK